MPTEGAHLTEIRVYDPARRPTDWTEVLQPGQFAVFMIDVRTGGAVRADGRSAAGSPPTCLVLDSLEEAKTFCHATVDRASTVRCDVYDQRGTGVPPLLSIVNPRHARRLPNRGKVRVMAIIGIAMIVPSPVLFWWDYRHGLALLWPTFIAINLLVFGLRTVHWAYMELEGLRQRERATEAAEAAEAARREPL